MSADGEMETRTLRVADLEVGMVCQEPIETLAGLRLTAEGTELTLAMKTRILNFHRSAGCREPIRVALPAV